MSPTKDPKPEGKAAATGITLGIGMLSVLGKLYTIAKTDDTEKLSLACPECTAPTQKVKQQYVCQDNPKHTPFTIADAARMKEVDGKFALVDPDKIAEAKQSVLPEKELSLQVHKREEVQGKVYANGNAYVFMPDGAGATGANSLYGALIELLKKRPDLMLLAKTNMRQADHLVSVEVGLDDQLVVQELIWPEDMKDFQPVMREKPTQKNLALGEALLEASVEPFDPSEYAKDSKARVREVIEEAAGATPKKKPSKAAAKKAANDDLGDLLAAALAARKAS